MDTYGVSISVQTQIQHCLCDVYTISANFRGDMIHCYHNPCDNLDVMLTDDNIRFLGKTADSITKTLDQLSAPYQSDGRHSHFATMSMEWV